jgi:hypothetical protein
MGGVAPGAAGAPARDARRLHRPRGIQYFPGFCDVHADYPNGIFLPRRGVALAFCELRKCYPRKRRYVVTEARFGVLKKFTLCQR